MCIVTSYNRQARAGWALAASRVKAYSEHQDSGQDVRAGTIGDGSMSIKHLDRLRSKTVERLDIIIDKEARQARVLAPLRSILT
jgi:hypothetical protein